MYRSPKPKFHPPAFIKREPFTSAEKRKIIFSEQYSLSRVEYNEDNTPTALYNIFKELLGSLPEKDLKMCNVEGLFRSALSDLNIKDKTYI